jgi:hypothetical protein
LPGGLFKQRFDASRDSIRRIVQRCIDALHVEMLPPVRAFQRFDFPRERTAGDNQDVIRHRREGQALCASRRASTRRTAVVAASAASRQ